MIFTSNEFELTKKLAILELMNQLKDLTTVKDLTQLALDLDIMNFFEIQHYIAKLTEDKCIETVNHDNLEYIKLSDEGYSFVTTLNDKIPPSWRDSIKMSLVQQDSQPSQKLTKTSSVENISDREYLVSLLLLEGSKTLIDFKLTVFSSDHAGMIIENWNKDTALVYENIISSLTQMK